MSKHTPGPWQARQNGKIITIDGDVNGSYYYGIAQINARGDCDKGIPSKLDRANAEFIVRACNSHDDLLEACKTALHEMRNTVAPRDSFTDAVDQLDAAITKAETP
jgi:hypothetical protein